MTVRNGSDTLVPGIDYQVSYLDNDSPGTGKVLVEGMGNYAGSVMVEFSILAPEPVSENLSFLRDYAGHSLKEGSQIQFQALWDSPEAPGKIEFLKEGDHVYPAGGYFLTPCQNEEGETMAWLLAINARLQGAGSSLIGFAADGEKIMAHLDIREDGDFNPMTGELTLLTPPDRDYPWIRSLGETFSMNALWESSRAPDRNEVYATSSSGKIGLVPGSVKVVRRYQEDLDEEVVYEISWEMKGNETGSDTVSLHVADAVRSQEIRVVGPEAPFIEHIPAKATLYVGVKGYDTLQLAPYLFGNTGTIYFKSSKKSVAKVDKKTGVVTAKKAGSAKITAYLKGMTSVKAVCKVTVKEPTITLSPSSLSVKRKKDAKVTISTVPAATAALSVSSTKPKVATATVVEDGIVVHALKKGTAYIQIKAFGVTKKLKVKVKK